MAKVIDEEIQKGISWDGYKGSRVQEYIEKEMDSKIGCVYRPEGGSEVYCFKNEADKDEFLATKDESLIFSSFKLESDYEVRFNKDTLKTSYSVIMGTTGNSIDFQFKIVSKTTDLPSDAKAKIEYEINGLGSSEQFTKEISLSDGWTTVSENIDEYIKKVDKYSIFVKITGLSTMASNQLPMIYNVFDLSYTPTFEYNVAQNNRVIRIPYNIKGSDSKYLEFYIDGQSVSSEERMIIDDAEKSGTATINVSSQPIGQHSLQTRAYVKSSDGARFYTQSYFYTFAIEGETAPSFLMSAVMPSTDGVIEAGENLTINVGQFEQIEFNWAMYDFFNRRMDIKFSVDGTIVSQPTVEKNGDIYSFSYRPMESGLGKVLSVYAYGEDGEKLFNYDITLNVSEVAGGIKETTDGLLLKLQSRGRRNKETTTRDVWECKGSDGETYKATFNNFVWNAQQGWDENTESLSISNGAMVDFNIHPMSNDWAKNGGTIEIDLETFDIEDDNAVICECKDNISGKNSAFFRISATAAEFSTQNGVSVATRFKDNERLKIAFIGNKDGVQEDSNLIYIVVNGVLERAALFESGDKIFSDAALRIGNADGKCKVRLRSIRVYDRAISVDEAFNNYVVDSDNVQEIYEKNNVLKAGTMEIGFDEVANKLPVMIFTGNMNELCTEGQSTKGWYRFDVEYINRKCPQLNFVAFNALMKLQGTSSLGYPRKNFKLKTSGIKDVSTPEGFLKQTYELDTTSVLGNQRLKSKRTGERLDWKDFTMSDPCYMFDSEGNVLKRGKYRFRDEEGCHKANKWTLKADFMESSCSHNVGAGRSWNKIFENTPLTLGVNAGYTNQTYKDSAIVKPRPYYDYINKDGVNCHININDSEMAAQKDFVCRTEAQKICNAAKTDDVRTAVDGFPMVCFYRTSHESNEMIFIGQYNFINDKGSYEVFGFEGVEDPEDETKLIYDGSKCECWEGLKNANPISLFKTIDGWDDATVGWASTFESRYPDPDDDLHDASVGSPLYELCKWIVSTRHEKDTVYGGTINVDGSFAKHINDYQYGYTEGTKQSYEYFEGSGLEDNAENRQKKFETEKWEHFDVWKLAGYYIYLMRYGAVDQFVKNTMLFTDGNGKYDAREGNQYRKWFYINYDNDCLFGLRNNGELAFDWTLDRNTIDGKPSSDEDNDTNTYAMMGHDSTLWNNLEADAEFMRMVRDLDDSMSKNGLNYRGMVEEFDTKQTEMWCERIYNANERYKYIYAAKGIGDMADREPVNNLWMLQGTRRSHRHWWIANHFNLLDAKWLSGDYKNTYVVIKTDAFAGDKIHTVAGADYYYAWGQQKKIYESNITAKEGETVDFVFDTPQVQGDPVYIYAVNKFSEMDFSDIAYKIAGGSFEFHVASSDVQNTLKKLVIGREDMDPNGASGITTSSWGCLNNLEYLDITNFQGIKTVPLASFKNLHTFKAKGSGVATFSPSEGSRFDLVELPPTITTLNLTDVAFGDISNFKYKPTSNLDSLTLSNNDGIDISYYMNIIKPWIESLDSSLDYVALYNNAYINVSNIKWEFGDLNDIWIFKNFKKYAKKGNFNLSGTINLSSCGNLTKEIIDEIKGIFGENCFNKTYASLYIITPDSIFINSDRDYCVAGQTQVFTRELYPDEASVKDSGRAVTITYHVVKEVDGRISDDVIKDITTNKYFLPIDPSEKRSSLTLTNDVVDEKEVGILKSSEFIDDGGDTNIIVLAKMKIMGYQQDRISYMPFTVKNPTYASRATINGTVSLYRGREYVYTISPYTKDGKAPIGTYTIEWSCDGSGMNYVANSAVTEDGHSLRLIMNDSNGDEPAVSAPLSITATISNTKGTPKKVSATFKALILNHDVILSTESNPKVMAICYANGWASTPDAMTISEAAAVTDISTAFSGVSGDFSFTEFMYFTGVTSIKANAFKGSSITNITLPKTIETIGESAFEGCRNLASISILNEENTRNEMIYINSLPEGIAEIPKSCFLDCAKLNKLIIPSTVKTVRDFAFGGTSFERVVLSTDSLNNGELAIPSGLKTIEGDAFEREKWAINTTSNPLKALALSKSMLINDSNISLLHGKNYEEFTVAEGNSNFSAKKGILYDGNQETILRYPPMNNVMVEEYVLDGSIRSIMEYAFFAVKNLKKVVTTGSIAPAGIGMHAFDSSEIEEVDLSASIQLGGLDMYLFANCRNLSKITLPKSGALKEIGCHVFDNCLALESLDLPDSIDTISDGQSNNGHGYNFYNCGLKELILPDGIKKSPMSMVTKCNSLKKLVMPKYYEWDRNYSIITECPSLEEITLPLFSYTAKKYAVMDNGETIAVYDTFAEAMAVMADGQSVKTVDGDNVEVNRDMRRGRLYAALKECPSLTVINLNKDDNQQLFQLEDNVLYTNNKKTLYWVPFGREEYKFIDGITTISSAFAECGKLREINIPDSVTRLEDSAFAICNGLTALTIPQSVNFIGQGALGNCVNLKTLEILGDNVTIDSFALNGCINLSTIVFSAPTAPALQAGPDYVEKSDVLKFHPFGYDNGTFVGKETAASGNNVLKLPYSHTGYNAEGWVTPLLRAEYCNFKIELTTLTKEVVITIYEDGQLKTEGTVYLTSESGEYLTDSRNVASAEYSLSKEGFSAFFNGKVYDNEKISVYSDRECNTLIGEFIAKYGKDSYTVGSPLMGTSVRRARAVTSEVLGASNGGEMANITKTEYDALLAKVDKLNDIINRMKI